MPKISKSIQTENAFIVLVWGIGKDTGDLSPGIRSSPFSSSTMQEMTIMTTRWVWHPAHYILEGQNDTGVTAETFKYFPLWSRIADSLLSWRLCPTRAVKDVALGLPCLGEHRAQQSKFHLQRKTEKAVSMDGGRGSTAMIWTYTSKFTELPKVNVLKFSS